MKPPPDGFMVILCLLNNQAMSSNPFDCVCVCALYWSKAAAVSTPKSNHATYTCRNLFFFFFSCPASRRSWWGPSLSGGKSAFRIHVPCILTWFWACALVPFCTFHQRLRVIFMSVVRISARRAKEKNFHRMTEWIFLICHTVNE